MSPSTTVRCSIVALAVAGLTMTGCSGIPGLTITPATVPPPDATKAPETPEPTRTRPTRPTASTEPSAPATPSTPASIPKPSSTRPATVSPRPTSTATSYNPPPDGDDIQNGYIPRATVELKVQSLIRQKTGKGSHVSCPGNLAAKVGEKLLCDLKTLDGKPTTNTVEISVTRIEGRRVEYFARIT